MRMPDLIAELEDSGWLELRRDAGHRQFGHPTRPGIITVAGPSDADVPARTLRGLMRPGGLDALDRQSS